MGVSFFHFSTGLSESDDDRTENEIIADELLRACTREFLLFIQAMVLEPKATLTTQHASNESAIQVRLASVIIV